MTDILVMKNVEFKYSLTCVSCNENKNLNQTNACNIKYTFVVYKNGYFEIYILLLIHNTYFNIIKLNVN